jgi:hypothetical protein
VTNHRWYSAGDLGKYEDVEVEGWERLVEDPDQLERAQPQRERRAREREQITISKEHGE